jgi:uncharacterized membrane protein
MRRLAAIIPLLAIFLLGTSPARAGLGICNQTSQTLWVAVGFYNVGTSEWASTGWWKTDPTKCVAPVDGALNSTYYFYYAANQNYDLVWSATTTKTAVIFV